MTIQIILPQSYAMSMDHALMALLPLIIANRTAVDEDVIQEIADMLRKMLIKSKGLKQYYQHNHMMRMHIHNTCLTAINRLKYGGRLKGEALCVVEKTDDKDIYSIAILGTNKRTWTKRITDEKWQYQRTFIFKVPDVV